MFTFVVLRRVSLLILAWTLTACAAIPPGAALTQPDKPAVRLAMVGEHDFDGLPLLEAVEALKENGYTISIDLYEDPNLATVALDNGDADFSAASARTVWTAASKGANVLTIMDRVSSNTWAFVTTAPIAHCSDLEGKRLALSSAGGLNRAMLDAYTQAVCPDITFQELIIPGSSSRIAAFLAGEIDASILPLPNVLELERQAPGQFHTLEDFGSIISGIITTGFHVNADFAAQNPEAVKDFLNAIVTANRRFNDDPAQIEVAAAKHLDLDGNDVSGLAQTYVSFGAWDVNGGLQPESVERSLAFYRNLEAMPKDAEPSSYIDTSYLDSVLDEIGRR